MHMDGGYQASNVKGHAITADALIYLCAHLLNSFYSAMS